MSAPTRIRRPGSSWIRGVVACAALATLAGCSAGPVTIDAPELSTADAQACRALVADLPDELAGQQRRDISGDTEYGAAWGDPAITVTCGVDQPKDFTDTSTCVTVDRTGWYVPDEVLDDMFTGDGKADVRTTELNFRPRVQLFLPGDYRPDGFVNSTGALAELIQRDLSKVGKCH